jgi:hypothetical protein
MPSSEMTSLQLAVMLDIAADLGGDRRVLRAKDERIEEDRRRRDRIDRRIHALGRHLARQHDHAVDMRRDCRDGRVREVVVGHVDRLDSGPGAVSRRFTASHKFAESPCASGR